MSFLTQLRSRIVSTKPAKTKRKAAARFCPRLESLEDRALLSTLSVLNANDSGPNSLRAEIAAARNGDTIVFAPIVAGQTINLSSGELLIKHSLTIEQPTSGEVTINAQNESRVFEIARGANVVINSLTITGGNAANGGGGIEVDARGTLTLTNCTLSGNKATTGGNGGGAIDNHGTLAINGGAVSNNSAFIGGGIHNEIGAKLTISNCALTGNAATNTGGAINNDGTLTISSGTISENSSLDGGAIGNDGGLSISGSTLSNNSTSYSGGAIYSFPGYNLPYHLTVSNCAFTQNSAGLEGGAVYVAGAGVNEIDGSTFGGAPGEGNSASRSGGAIFVHSGDLTLSGCVISYNSADPNGLLSSGGGGVYVDAASVVTVENGSSILNNTAPSGQGADVNNLGVMYADSGSINNIGVVNGNQVILK